jgi:hypothetical protein
MEQKVKNVDALRKTSQISLENACLLCGITVDQYRKVKQKNRPEDMQDVPDVLKDIFGGSK